MEIIEVGPECVERVMDGHQFPELEQADIWVGGLSTLRGHHRIERQFAGRAMLSFALEGGSYYQIGTHQGHWRGGEALFFPPETPFKLRLDEGAFRRSAWLIFEMRRDWLALRGLPHHFEWRDGPHFARALESLYAESFAPDSGMLRRLLVGQCREYILRKAREGQSLVVRDPRVESLLFDVAQNLAHPWSLAEMGRRANLSRAHLHRLFMQHYGCGPMARVTALRMQHAATLLRSEGGSKVASIAEAVGYINAFYFSSAFKRFFGVSPRAYRQGEYRPGGVQSAATGG